MKTGYFGRATENGYTAKSTQVHITDSYARPICRYRPHRTMQFQWCASGVMISYVECKQCKEQYKKSLYKLAKKI